MEISRIKDCLNQQDKNVIYVTKIEYRDQEYVKAIRSLKCGIDYIYYRIDKNSLKRVDNIKLINYFNEAYGVKASDILY